LSREAIDQRIAELKQEKLGILKQLDDHKEKNLIEYFKRPNPLQEEMLEAWLDSHYKVFTYTGANRIGKTTILTLIGFSTMFGHFPWNRQRLSFPHTKPRKVRLVGQDWEKHIKAVVIPALRKWWPQSRGSFADVTRKNNQGVEAYWTDPKTGSTLEIMSNMQESDLHEGWDGDLILYDEPPKRKIRVANARGLIDREGRELFACTLLKEAWLDTDVIKARNEDGSPDTTVFSVDGDISVNVGFGITQEGVDQFAKTLNEDEKQARLEGKPSYLSGLVCKNFNRKAHLKKRFEIPLDWIVDIGIDIHPRKEQAILFMATSPKQERWLCFELWKHGNGTQVGEWIIRLIKRHNLRVGRIICDPLAKGDRNNEFTTFDKIDMVLGRYEYVLYTGTKDKESGILEINNHLMGPNNEPSLFVFNDMVRTCHEFEAWMYDEDTQKPQKKDDDDMMENLYRLLLENTIWYPMEEEDDEEYRGEPVSSSVTGY